MENTCLVLGWVDRLSAFAALDSFACGKLSTPFHKSSISWRVLYCGCSCVRLIGRSKGKKPDSCHSSMS